jgi:hypothetical protein
MNNFINKFYDIVERIYLLYWMLKEKKGIGLTSNNLIKEIGKEKYINLVYQAIKMKGVNSLYVRSYKIIIIRSPFN